MRKFRSPITGVAANETDESRKRDALTAHARTLRRHIESLSRKEYQASVGESSTHVMFLPGEHFSPPPSSTDPMLSNTRSRKDLPRIADVLLPLLRAVAADGKRNVPRKTRR